MKAISLTHRLKSLGKSLLLGSALLMFHGQQAAAQTFSNAIVDYGDGTSIPSASIRTTPSGDIYALWKDGGNSALTGVPSVFKLIKWNEVTAAWGAPIGQIVYNNIPGLLTGYAPGDAFDLAIDSEGGFHVTLQVPLTAGGDGNGVVYAYSATGSSWTYSTVVNYTGINHSPSYVSLELDSADNPHIFLLEKNIGSGLPFNQRMFTVWHFSSTNGTTWVPDSIYSQNGGTGTSVNEIAEIAATMDSNDKAHLLLSVEATGNNYRNITYTTNASGSWVNQVVVPTSTSSQTHDMDMVVDSTGKIHAVYSPISDRIVHYLTNRSGSWADTTINGGALSGRLGAFSKRGLSINGANDLFFVYNSSPTSANAGNLSYGFLAGATGNSWQTGSVMNGNMRTGDTISTAITGSGRAVALFEHFTDPGATGSPDNSPINSRQLQSATAQFAATVPTPNLTINDVTQNEGNTGTTSFSFTASLSSAAPAGGVTFNYATANNTATAGSDYVAASGTGTIAAGQTSTTITVTVNGDTAIEPNETFAVNLSGATNAVLTDNQGVGTITNDDFDTTDPDTSFTSFPPNPTNDNTPTFAFTGTDNIGVTSYEVRGGTSGAFNPATSPYTVSVALVDGTYTFQVRAKDAAGNVDATPASYTFTVDTTAPDTAIVSGPPSLTNSTSATYDFSSNEASVSYQVSLDGGAFVSSPDPVTFTGLADGAHTLAVRAVDAAGNVDPTPATYAWTVDTTPPAAPVVGTPPNGSLTNDNTPTFSGIAESGSTVTVFIDGAQAGTGTGTNWSFTPTTPLADGSHTVRATSTDAAGNTSVNSNTNTFTVDATGPTVTLTTAATSPAPIGGFTVTATFSEAVTGFVLGDITMGNATATNLVTSDNITYNFTVTPDAPGVTVTASVPAAVAVDGATNTNTASNPLSIEVVNKALTITADAASVTEGTGSGTTAFGFTVSRVGPTTGPVTVNYAVTGSGGNPADATDFGGALPTGTVTIPDGDASVPLTINVSKDSTRESNEAFTVTLSGPDNDYVLTTATASSTITNDDFEADLSITAADGVTTATPGGAVTYTITASNAGPDPVIGATVTDTFPASVTATWTAVGAGGGTVVAAGSGNINTTVNLPVGATVTFTVSASINASATGTLSNTAAVSAPAGTTDPTPGNNSATDTDTLTPEANLSITMTDGVTTATPGGSVTYTITASNPGPSNAPGATVACTFPASVTATWTGEGAGGGTATAAGSGNINDTVNLPAGGSVTYTVTAAISPSATGSLSTTATVAAPGGVSDPTPGNNSASDTDTLNPQADLAITVTDGATTGIPGNSVTYTITVSNAGPSNATGATVADTFPASLTDVTWTAAGAGGGTALSSGLGNINELVNLPAGGSVTYTVEATISAAATGTLSNTATVSAPGGVTDPTPGNNSGTDTDTLTRQADLAVTVTDGVTSVSAGEDVTYTITVSNPGPSDSPATTVADTFPAALTSVNWTAAGTGVSTGFLTSGNGNIFDVINLPAGTSVTYTVDASLSPTATGTLSNTATVTPPLAVTDTNTANNSATDTDTIDVQADVSVMITDSPDPVEADENITYTVTLRNNGPSEATGVSVSVPLPEGVTFISAAQFSVGGSPNGWGNTITKPAVGSAGTVTISPDGGMGSDAEYYYSIVGKVGYVGNGTVLTATATASTATTDPNSLNNTASTTTTVSATPEIALHNGGSTIDAPLTDGQATAINFGTTTVDNPLTRSFTIANTGNDILSLTSIAVPSGFSLVNPFSPPTQGFIFPGNSYTFQVRYDAGSIGTASGDIVIANNDTDEAPFNFPITAERENVAPVAVTQDLTINEDEVKPITLTGSDADEQPISFIIVDQPLHGTLTGTLPNMIYTPDADYNGADVFTFKTNDGTTDSAEVEVNLTITPVNDAPRIVGAGMPDLIQIRPDVPRTIDLTEYFSDPETAAASLTYTVVAPAEAQAVVAGSSLQINGSVAGAFDITVTATDPDTLNVSDTFALTVKRVPQLAGAGVPPTLVSPSEPTFDLDLAGYFIDGDGDALTYAITNNTDPGVFTATINGSIVTITPVTSGVASLTILVSDSDGNSISHTFEVTIDDPVPDATPTVTSPPKLNRQTGLYEITLTATNNNQFNVPGFRFRVTSVLPSHIRLYNSTAPIGSAEAYLDVLNVLTPGQSITIVLEFHSTTRNFTGFDPTIIAEPLPEGTSNAGTGEGMEINRFLNLADGSKLIEFSSIAGRWYEIQYSSDLITWKRSLVPVQAGANFTQWIDRGAPYTESHPSTVPQRFYRVSEILPD